MANDPIDDFLDRVSPVESNDADPIDSFLDRVESAKPKTKQKELGRTIGGTLGDIGVTGLKSAVGLAESGIGLADLATGGQAGKLAEDIGIRTQDTQNILDSMYSPAQQAASQNVEEAKGFVPTLGALAENPSVIATSIGESGAVMGGGQAIAKGLLKYAPKVAPFIASAIGEGVLGSGSSAEGVRQQTDDRLLTGKQSLLTGLSGALTGAISAGSGKLAKNLGLGNIDTALLPDDVIANLAPKNMARRIAEGGLTEGFLEELPQSAQEQILQNIALNKPLMEGVPEGSAIGLAAGSVMGGGINALPQAKPKGPLSRAVGDRGEKIGGEQKPAWEQPAYSDRNYEDERQGAIIDRASEDNAAYDKQKQNLDIAGNKIDLIKQRKRREFKKQPPNKSQIASLVNELQVGGGITVDKDGKRNKSLNPDWFKDGNFKTKKADGTYNATAVSRSDIETATKSFLAGRKLTSKQQSIINELDDIVKSQEQQSKEFSQAEDRADQDNLNDQINALVNDAKGTEVESALSMAVVDGSVRAPEDIDFWRDDINYFKAQNDSRKQPDTKELEIDSGATEQQQADAIPDGADAAGVDAARIDDRATDVITTDGLRKTGATSQVIDDTGRDGYHATGRDAEIADASPVDTVPASDQAERYDRQAKAVADTDTGGLGFKPTHTDSSGEQVQLLPSGDYADVNNVLSDKDDTFTPIVKSTEPVTQDETKPKIQDVSKSKAEDAKKSQETTAERGVASDSIILTQTESRYINNQLKKEGIKKSSPGYKAAKERVEEQYQSDLERAEVSLPFEEYVKLPVNKDQSESLLKQAYDAIRKDLKITDERKDIPAQPETDKATDVVVAKPSKDAAEVSGGKEKGEVNSIDKAATDAALSPSNNLSEPTEKQKEAGNYKLGHASINGLNISIENPKGSVRSGTDRDGKKWSINIKSHYGYFKGTVGKDKDHVDVFVGDNAENAESVFVVDQVEPSTGKFDEHKVMLGYENKDDAIKAYNENYDKDWKGLDSITEMSLPDFKVWVIDKNKTSKRADESKKQDKQVQVPTDSDVDIAQKGSKEKTTKPVAVAKKTPTKKSVSILDIPQHKWIEKKMKAWFKDHPKASKQHPEAKSFKESLDELYAKEYDAAADESLKGVKFSKAAKTLDKLNNEIEKLSVDSFVTENDRSISVSKIIVDKAGRNKGTGSKVMQMITDYADSVNKVIALTPSKDFGATSLSRLIKFYKQFGFVENKGKNKDYLYTDSMYRNPITKGKYSKAPKTTGSTVEQITSLLPKRVKAMVNAGKLKVVQSVGDLPKALQKRGSALYHAAFHGGPHDFDKFTTDAIGTGEGAQAYGYGLYFAEKKAVADWYRESLTEITGKDSFVWNGARYDRASPEGHALGLINDRGVIKARKMSKTWIGTESYSDKTEGYFDVVHNVTNKVRTKKDFQVRRGYVYEVELAPKQDEYLLWDKPLSEQSDKVKELIKLHKNVIEDALDNAGYSPDIYAFNGKELYGIIKKIGSNDYLPTVEAEYERSLRDDERASIYLHSLGIRGIKYLDGSSRGKGEGNYNYVVFDDADVEITTKYSELDGVEALYNESTDEMYLVADMLNKDNIDQVLNHELFHRLENTDPKLQKAISTFDKQLNLRLKVAKNGKATPIENQAAQRVMDAETKTSDELAEFKAYMVTGFTENPDSFTGRIKKIIQQFIAEIKMAMMRMGILPKNLKPADLYVLAKQGAKVKGTISNRTFVDNGNVALASKQGYKGNDPVEAQEWTEAVNAGLDMSKEARMQRAKDMGFDVDTVYYHGTDENFEAFDPATVGDNFIQSINTGGFFFTESSRTGDSYGAKRLDVYLKTKKPLVVKKPEIIKEFEDADYPTERYYNPIDVFDTRRADLIRDARQENKDSIVIEGFKKNSLVVVFNPNQIRSINAAFNPDWKGSGNLLASKAPKQDKRKGGFNSAESMDKINKWFNGEPLSSSNKGSLGLAEESRVEKAARVFQDGFNRVKTLQKTIEAQGGEVTDESNVYLAEERSSGITAARLDDLRDNNVRPLIDAMAESDITLKQLDSFVTAKHARERNDYIASINPSDKMQDGGSGMSYAEADKILADFGKQGLNPKLSALADRVYEINDNAISDMVQLGLMDSKTANALRGQYENYVPLKGKEGVDERGGSGQGYSVSGAGLKKAMGRGEGNLSESPVAHSIAQAENILIRGEKAKVGKALVKLMKDNPDPNFWSVTQTNYNKFISLAGEEFEGFDQIPEGLIEKKDFHRVMAITAAEKKQAKLEGRKPKARVAYRLDPAYKFREDVFSVMIEGKLHQITIEDKILAEQLKKLNSNELNYVIKGMGEVNRYLAMINTALNPEFVITNLERDLQTAGINLAGEHSAKMAKQVMKDVPKAIKGIWLSVFKKEGAKDNEWSKLYEELKHEGGTIGFFGLEDIETKVSKIESELTKDDSYLGKTKQSLAKIQEAILNANQSVENASRLAAYKAARDKGMSKNKAASLAKNLTVNFNRRGDIAPVLNAAYLFANASIQGTARIFTALKHPKVRKIVGGIASASFALAMYNMSAGGEDDDGVSHWEKLSDHMKQTNLIIMHPDGSGDYSKFKMPYGYNVFWYAGTALHDLMFGKNTTVMGTAGHMMTTIVNAFNPIQGADLLDTITPTILKPIEQDARNISFMSTPIRPENPFDRYDRPDSDKAFLSTNKTLKDFAKFINEATGGDDTKAGFIDVSPETIKHYLGWVSGGAGMTAYRGIGTAGKVFSGETIKAKEVPFLRTLGGSTGTYYDTERFYKAIEDVQATKAQVGIYREQSDPRAGKYRADNRRVIGLSKSITGHKKRIKRMRTMKNRALRNGHYKLADQFKQSIAKEMRWFLRKYDVASK